MPGPDANTIWIEPNETGGYSAQFEVYFWTGNKANRLARVKAIGKRMMGGTWRCRRCGDDLSQDKRADTRFCSEGCRKKSVRKRREEREHWMVGAPSDYMGAAKG